MTNESRFNEMIIHPDIEPGVIDNEMLTRCILEYGPKGEAGRLFAEEGVHLDEAEIVRLEFQNILRIDHLWMLKSLKKLTLAHNFIEKIENLDRLPGLIELDLSFNKIEKIENLEALVNLEVLTLFSNKIRKLENMDTLNNLLVFSIGDNLIEDFKEAAYLRRFRALRSVSFKGNPCCDDGATYLFLKAALTRVTYLDYKVIKDEEREEGQAVFRMPTLNGHPVDDTQAAYLRRFRALRSVSFKGNPCCDDGATYLFLKAALTRVTYLDYKVIKDDEREEGQAVFRSVLRKLDEEDEKSEKERLDREDYNEKVEFYKLSFVEYLSGPELLEAMFEKDPDGTMLLEVGGELTGFYEQYKEQYVETMGQLVEYAQEAYRDRQHEVSLFQDLVDTALADSVEKSKAVIEEYKQSKIRFIDQMNEQIALYMEKKEALEQIEPRVLDLSETYNEVLYDLWKKLMTLEMQLYEQCEESRTQFAVNMTEMITKFLEHSRNAFGQWREVEGVWSMRQYETLSKMLGNKVLLGDVSPELLEIMMDRDLMVNAVAQSSDNHMRFIDSREDLVTSRAAAWRDRLVQGTNDDEIKRNRDRIMEINYFIDNQREEWTDLQMNLTETVDPETAALLGDDI